MDRSAAVLYLGLQAFPKSVSMTHPPARIRRRRSAARVAALYLVLATLWILGSDQILALVAADPQWQHWLGTAKGLVYVLLTALLLYLLLRVWPPAPAGRVERLRPRWLPLAFLGLALAVPLLAGIVVWLEGTRVRNTAEADLAAIAQLKSREIEDWLRERLGDARSLMYESSIAEQAERWLSTGDAAAEAALAGHLKALRHAFHYEVAWLGLGAESTDPARQALLAAAWRDGRVQMGDLYRDASGRVWLDLVVPLLLLDQHHPVGAALLRIPADQFLFPLVQTWPTPSPSAETLLVRRDGQNVLFLNRLRHNPATPLTMRLPLSRRRLPAALGLQAKTLRTVEGIDYRGVPVMAATRPVHGTDWVLVAKMDRSEVLGPLYHLVAWVSVIGLAAILVVAAVVLLLWREQQIAHRLDLKARVAKRDRLLLRFYDLPFLGMGIVDPTSRVWLRVNDRLCDILGLPRERLLRTSWDCLTHPEDLAADQAQWAHILSGAGEAYRMEKRFLRPDGTVVETSTDVRCLRRDDGGVEHMVTTVQDITARKRDEAALTRQRALLEAIMGATDVKLVYLDRDFRFLMVNRAFAETCRKTQEELVERGYFALYPDPEAEAIFLRVRDTGESVFCQDQPLRFPDQPERGVTYWDWSLTPVREGAGPVSGLVYSLRETTAYRRAQLALAESEARLQLALKVGRAGTWDWDLHGGHMVWSQGHYEILGYREGRVTPSYEAWTQRLHPEDLPRMEEEIRRSMAERTEYLMDFRVIWPDGSRHWMSARAHYEYDADGTCRRMLGVMADVTERKQAELKLQEADRRKDELLAMLAHELRNPLTPIRNAAHVLGLLDLPEPRVQWARDTIERHVSHLAQLVDDLLDVSRIAWGKIRLQRDLVDLEALVEQALESARPLLNGRRQHLEVHLPKGSVRLEGDPVRLCQVLVNLLDNAAKYSPEGSAVTLTAETAGEELEIRVQDQGMGIPAELLPYVFDLFRQDERSLDRRAGGLGIGLTMVQRLVELHGGQVQAYSAGPGHGSTFTVRLPLGAAPPAARAPGTPSPKSATQAHILVVDDDQEVAESTRLVLELEGHRVAVAYSGEQALERLADWWPSICLLDLGLPGINGYETATRLRALPRGAQLCLVAISGYGDEETRERCRAAGFDGHLVKPVEPQRLRDFIADAHRCPRAALQGSA
jgi:PAS domain S-box-containing protein